MTPLDATPVDPTRGAVPPALFNRAVTAHTARDFPLAVDLWTQVIGFEPDRSTLASAFYNRGQARHTVGDHVSAADDFRRVLHLFPDNASAWHKYAAALLNSHDDVPALAAIEKAIDLDPANAEFHHCYAGVLSTFNDDERALTEWGIAHQLDPNRAETAIGQAMTMLRRSAGRDTAGWRLFESRRAKGITDLYPGMPLWHGQPAFPIAGKTILVRCEQGYGDTLQFVRYVHPLVEAGAHVTLETPRSLMRLFRHALPPAVKLHESRPGLPAAHDFQTALMTLPLAFPDYAARDPSPTPVGYLGVRPGDVPAASGFRAGLVWHGGARPEDPDANSIDGRRSLPEAVGLMLQHELALRCPVVSLQQEDLPRHYDFYDTAALVASLDLVITVDTAIAHLAGAMGRPVWLLDRYSPCWRWGLGTATTHWYPTMTIYRQATPKDWEPVIRRVLRDIDALLVAPRP